MSKATDGNARAAGGELEELGPVDFFKLTDNWPEPNRQFGIGRHITIAGILLPVINVDFAYLT